MTNQWFLFPGRHGRGHMRPDSASRLLREAMNRIGLEGASTHSFRRTALTIMSNSGVPLRIIQAVSGHRSLEVLEEYLAVGDEQVRGAIACLAQVSYVKKIEDVDVGPTPLNPWRSDEDLEPEDTEKYL